jgi:putative hydrolase of the HAD superfamily
VHVTPVPGAPELLAALDARGIRHAILTNGWSPLQERKARAIGYRGPVLVSDTLGVRKPEAAAFAALVDALGNPAVCWYVGDDPAVDAAGAMRAGLRAIWFDGEVKDQGPVVSVPTATVRMLAEVPAILFGE